MSISSRRLCNTPIVSRILCALSVLSSSVCLGRLGDDLYCIYEMEPKHTIVCMLGDPTRRMTVLDSDFKPDEMHGHLSTTVQRELSVEGASLTMSLEKDGDRLSAKSNDGKTCYLLPIRRLGPDALMATDYDFFSLSPRCFALVAQNKLLYQLNSTLHGSPSHGGNIRRPRWLTLHNDGTAESEKVEFALFSIPSVGESRSKIFLIGRISNTDTYFIMIGRRSPTE